MNNSAYCDRHGGPYDRGMADSYYRRGARPHYFTGRTYKSLEITESKMTAEEIEAYYAGYEHNEKQGNFKDWN